MIDKIENCSTKWAQESPSFNNLEMFPPLSSETSCFKVSGKHPSPIRCNCIIIYNACRQERHFPPFISSIFFMLLWAALHVRATFIMYCNFSAGKKGSQDLICISIKQLYIYIHCTSFRFYSKQQRYTMISV